MEPVSEEILSAFTSFVTKTKLNILAQYWRSKVNFSYHRQVSVTTLLHVESYYVIMTRY